MLAAIADACIGGWDSKCLFGFFAPGHRHPWIGYVASRPRPSVVRRQAKGVWALERDQARMAEGTGRWPAARIWCRCVRMTSFAPPQAILGHRFASAASVAGCRGPDAEDFGQGTSTANSRRAIHRRDKRQTIPSRSHWGAPRAATCYIRECIRMPTTVHIPAALLKSVDRRAIALGVSRNRLIVQALEQAVSVRARWAPEFLDRLRDVDDDTVEAVDDLMEAVKRARRSKPARDL